MTKLSIVILIIWAVGGKLFCEDGRFFLEKRLTPNDGLPQSFVWSIKQDDNGYLWIGTRKGLSRYNGFTFKNYNKQSGLKTLRIRSLCILRNGNVAIGTFNGAFLLDVKSDSIIQFVDSQKKISGKIYTIFEASDGTIYFGTSKNGVIYFRNNEYGYLNTNTGLISNAVSAIIESKEKEILIGYRTSGITIIDGKVFRHYHHEDGLISHRIRSFVLAKNKDVIILTARGFCKYANGRISLLLKTDLSKVPRGANVVLNNDGSITFISSYEVMTFDFESVKKLNISTSAGNYFRSLCITKNNTLFIGTRNKGILKYKKKFISVFNPSIRFPNNNIFSITKDANGNIYFATKGSGIIICTKNGQEILNLKNCLSDKNFNQVYAASDGRIYLGTSRNNGVNVISNFRIIYDKEFDKLKHQTINFIYEIKDKGIFFLTNKNIWQYYKSKLFDFGKEIGIKNFSFETMLKTKNGDLYLGINKYGLLKISESGNYLYTLKDGLTSNIFCALEEMNSGAILIATDNGLSLLMNRKFKNYSTKNGLSSNHIFFVREYNLNEILIGTNKGLNILTLDNHTLNIKNIRKYTYQDGLSSNEFNKKAVYKTEQGIFYLGTVDGVTILKPKNENKEFFPPQIRIDSIFAGGKILAHVNNIAVSSYSSFGEVYYSVIDVDSPEKVELYFRTSKFANWAKGNKKKIIFKLKENKGGVIELFAKNNWGIKSKVNKISYNVFTPFYFKMWFFGVSMLLVVFVFIFIYKKIKIDASFNESINSNPQEIYIKELSKRENDLIPLLLKGYSYKKIAEELFVSVATVQSHIKNIYKKLNVHSRYELYDVLKKYYN